MKLVRYLQPSQDTHMGNLCSRHIYFILKVGTGTGTIGLQQCHQMLQYTAEHNDIKT